MRAISMEAECGPNYVQQMIHRRSDPGTDRLVRILQVLGGKSAIYVLTGMDMNERDEQFMKAAAALTPKMREAALRHFLELQELQGSEEPSPDSQASDASTPGKASPQ